MGAREKYRRRVHDASANVTRNRKGAYQSRDTTSIRIFRLILSVISLNKHGAVPRRTNPRANYFRAGPFAIKNCISRVRIIPWLNRTAVMEKSSPTRYITPAKFTLSPSLCLPHASIFYLRKRRRDGKYFMRGINKT